MKNLIALSILVHIFLTSCAQLKYDDYFTEKALRIDYYQAGNVKSTSMYYSQTKQEAFWSGSKNSLIEPFEYGTYCVSVFDSVSGKLIYKRGYNTLSQEWLTTDEAKRINKAFPEYVRIPFPKKSIKVKIVGKDRKHNPVVKFEQYINPNDYFIKKETNNFEVKKFLDNGNYNNKADILFLPEGYTKDQMQKFMKDCKNFTDNLFLYSPYKENKSKFNAWAVLIPSSESGTDIPGENIWKNTVLNSNFYTFGTDRYITTSDMFSVGDASSNVPYDVICIITNTEKYGGGGVYNFYSLFVSDNYYSNLIFVHEFGHGFAGLADEYYTSDVAYVDYYDLTVEPLEPNLTTLVNFDKKWKKLVDPATPIPTPNKENYKKSVGAFEGGGYTAKGVYRPGFDCIMKSMGTKEFCPVCKNAIIEMIDYYTK